MAEIYVKTSSSSSSNNSSYITSRRESFTLWMKSLMFHQKGCTVYDSNGNLVYRIDNYGQKCTREVDLMDVGGNVLFSIQQIKKIPFLGHWDVSKWNGNGKVMKKIPSFQVKKYGKDLNTYVVSLLHDGDEACCYLIQGGASEKSAFRISDIKGIPIAEVKQKQSSSGVNFGEDVLSLVVEPQVDHSLVMALVTVYELINRKL
ncbi:OLC1v1029644C1 [Oldenlandia corymbosa var. corymbosa]|uniref:OLC1v1029644C1 n=1 Tax=Oldenlandia corymbosa var. corymbosa TaxID=529605 RepID=A0AAV1CF08_OLDCO|nr:OLC1v1029644C1 [Oldenlandia corymbosa var. corymbosa]